VVNHENPALFFGQRWGVPALEGAIRINTPVGMACLTCKESIVDGDRGFIRAAYDGVDYRTAAIHAECELLGIVGHDFGSATAPVSTPPLVRRPWCSGIGLRGLGRPDE
jgi:hypothetical protein